MPLALCPVRGFPTRPGWTLRHRLLRPVCPNLTRYCPSQPSFVCKKGQVSSPVAVWLLEWVGLASEHVPPDWEPEN